MFECLLITVWWLLKITEQMTKCCFTQVHDYHRDSFFYSNEIQEKRLMEKETCLTAGEMCVFLLY